MSLRNAHLIVAAVWVRCRCKFLFIIKTSNICKNCSNLIFIWWNLINFFNGLCGVAQMRSTVLFRFWHINIISNIYRTLYIVLSWQIINYIAKMIVINLSRSPKILPLVSPAGVVNVQFTDLTIWGKLSQSRPPLNRSGIHKLFVRWTSLT